MPTLQEEINDIVANAPSASVSYDKLSPIKKAQLAATYLRCINSVNIHDFSPVEINIMFNERLDEVYGARDYNLGGY
jgi:hypothetical protein